MTLSITNLHSEHRLHPADLRAMRAAALELISAGDVDCKVADVARMAGVSHGGLPRHSRRTRLLVRDVVADVLVDARRSIFHRRSTERTVDHVVRQLVLQRLSVHDAIVDVMPAVLDRGIAIDEFRALSGTLRSANDFELSKFMDGMPSAERCELLATIASAVSLTWIDCLRRAQGRSPQEIAEMLTAQVMFLLDRHGVEASGARVLMMPLLAAHPGHDCVAG